MHSDDDFDSAMKVSDIVFNHKASPESLRGMSADQLKMIAQELPYHEITLAEIGRGISLDELLTSTGILASKGDVRRAVKNNAISINKIKTQTHDYIITSEELLQKNYLMIENGKKNKFMIGLK